MYSDAMPKESVTTWAILKFFIPLGLAASLVTVSHFIINLTLARAVDQETVIASYSIAMSLLGIVERPAFLMRQTCSALVRDQISFRAMAGVAYLVFAFILLTGLAICYTPVGEWIFGSLFGVKEDLLDSVIHVYRVLMFVSIFSGFRCLYQGIIIINMHTKWLTIGMVIRLFGMALLAMFFILTGVTSGAVGAWIFLTGMMIEAGVAYLEGRKLKRALPEKKEGHEITKKKHIFHFYRPLLFSSIIAVIIGPATNKALGFTGDMDLAVASFAIAANIVQLTMSFFSYIHQIVLNFYRIHPSKVQRFVRVISFIPTILTFIIAFTPVGHWIIGDLMNVKGELLEESISTLKMFMLTTLMMPWLDFCNGLLMLKDQTRVMFWSQLANVLTTVTMLILLVAIAAGWNGKIGAIAQSLGMAAEISVVSFVLLRERRRAL